MVDVPTFDREALIAALRTDRAGDGTFPEFLAASWPPGLFGTMLTSPRERRAGQFPGHCALDQKSLEGAQR